MTELARGLIYGLVNFRIGNQGELDRAARLIADAAAINPNDPGVLNYTAFLLRARGRFTEAIVAYQRLLDEYPNTPGAYKQIGMLLTYAGRSEEAIPIIEMAIRRDAQDPSRRFNYENLGYALLMLGRDEESIVWTRRALAATPDGGQLEEAHRAVADANRIWPYYTVRMLYPEGHSSRVYAAQIERQCRGSAADNGRCNSEQGADAYRFPPAYAYGLANSRLPPPSAADAAKPRGCAQRARATAT